MRQIKKRDGRIVQFNEQKIENAIYKAFLDDEFYKNGKHIYAEKADEHAKEMLERVIKKN